MAAKSPTSNVKSREVIGEEQFSQRREVFDKYDTVFLPLPSPTSPIPAYREVDPIITSNHGKTTTNFKRNTSTYSSMRETKTGNDTIDFRPRKYSDNFLSEHNQSDDVDYRRSMTERTRRLCILRRDFLNSNIHEPGSTSPFSRTGTRASMPASSVTKYKIESPNLYKFPFAEPFATPPPVRRVIVDLGPTGLNNEKENEDPESKPKHKSLPNQEQTPVKSDGQKLYEELMKRYSPQRKPVDWKLPPTKARVVGSVPKSLSSVADSIDSADKKVINENHIKAEDDDVFLKKESDPNSTGTSEKHSNNVNIGSNIQNHEEKINTNFKEETGNRPVIVIEEPQNESTSENDQKPNTVNTDTKEEIDNMPELSATITVNNDMIRNKSYDKFNDLTIPALIDKMTEEGADLESHRKQKKVKRNRSFLDKLFRRNKKDK